MRTVYCALLVVQVAWAQPINPGIRHANETDKPAIFGYMINERASEMRGYSREAIYRQCVVPSLLCGLLAPIYFRLASRSIHR